MKRDIVMLVADCVALKEKLEARECESSIWLEDVVRKMLAEQG